jgi:hypothetical protein
MDGHSKEYEYAVLFMNFTAGIKIFTKFVVAIISKIRNHSFQIAP